MTELSLKKSGRRLEDHYDVVADGAVVGRITLFTTTPAELPWVWTIAPGHEKDRTQTHGHAATREAALEGVCQELAPEMSECLSAP
jgi:hypothetical protein